MIASIRRLFDPDRSTYNHTMMSVIRTEETLNEAIKAAQKYPAGTGSLGWLERTGETYTPHNDFFLLSEFMEYLLLCFLCFLQL
jgi:hypothetical protein